MLKKQLFGNYLTDIFNCSALNLAMSIGYEKRLFDIIMDECQKALTCRQIARRARVNQRYLKAWLGIMVTGRDCRYNTGHGWTRFATVFQKNILHILQGGGGNSMCV